MMTEGQVTEYPDRQQLLYSALGSLVPLLVHNLNNYLTGVLGNIDLAGMCRDEPAAASARLDDARNASFGIRDFLAELMRFLPGEGDWTPGSFHDTVAVARLACGRSVSLDTSGTDLLPSALPVPDIDFRAMMLGLLSWAVRSCCGSGSVTAGVTAGGGTTGFQVGWTRETRRAEAVPGSGLPAWIRQVAGNTGAVLTSGPEDSRSSTVTLTFHVHGI
jgi:hypothetical protein